ISPSQSAIVKLGVAALLAACFAAGPSTIQVGQAATYTWTGNTSFTADDIGNWNGLAGNFVASDFAYWNGNQAGSLNLSLSGNAVMNPAAPGVNFYIDSGQTSPVSINGSGTGAVSTMRMNSITINPSAGAFTIGSASLA